MARASGTDSDFFEISSPFSSIARQLHTQVTDYFFAVTRLHSHACGIATTYTLNYATRMRMRTRVHPCTFRVLVTRNVPFRSVPFRGLVMPEGLSFPLLLLLTSSAILSRKTSS